MRIHDADVVYTDLGLALLGGVLAWRLWRYGDRGYLTRAGVTIMAALAGAAFFGAVFHAFFPANTSTRAGYLAWVPVSLSIAVVAATLLSVGLRVLFPRLSLGVRRGIVLVYVACFAGTVLFIDESYEMIVRFYAPTVLLFLVATVRHAMRGAGIGWWLLSLSFALSVVAALLQQTRIALHREYFDHNALYHVVQAIALVVLYIGVRRVGRKDPARSA
ncbi:MAG: DUF6962 family protein [Gemmatimonadaceae bacterium]